MLQWPDSIYYGDSSIWQNVAPWIDSEHAERCQKYHSKQL